MLQIHTNNKLNFTTGGHYLCRQKLCGRWFFLLRLVLMLALAWLPVSGVWAEKLLADDAEAKTFVSVHALQGSAEAHVQYHNSVSPGADVTGVASADTMPENCARHLAPCCSACVSYYELPALVLMPASSFGVDRYLHYSEPVSIIILAQDIRPPIG